VVTEPKPVSDEERFMRMMANFQDFGTDWHFRKAAAYGYLPPMVAYLRGANGTVEVWGGAAHRYEVWFIGKDKEETLVAYDGCDGKRLSLRDGTLRAAIAEACDLAGVQYPLF
jgi:hypothetical protein